MASIIFGFLASVVLLQTATAQCGCQSSSLYNLVNTPSVNQIQLGASPQILQSSNNQVYSSQVLAPQVISSGQVIAPSFSSQLVNSGQVIAPSFSSQLVNSGQVIAPSYSSQVVNSGLLAPQVINTGLTQVISQPSSLSYGLGLDSVNLNPGFSGLSNDNIFSIVCGSPVYDYPYGVSVSSENAFGGSVAVSGAIPFLGSTYFGGDVPSAGNAALSFGAGPNVALQGGGCNSGLAGTYSGSLPEVSVVSSIGSGLVNLGSSGVNLGSGLVNLGSSGVNFGSNFGSNVVSGLSGLGSNVLVNNIGSSYGLGGNVQYSSPPFVPVQQSCGCL